MVPHLPWKNLAYGLHLLRLRQSQHCSRVGRILPISTGRIVIYASRHSGTLMTSYGKCCGRTIVAKNWKFCPFDGTPLSDGQPVTLRERISTGMDRSLPDNRLDDTTSQTDIRSFSLDLVKKTVVQLRAIAKDVGVTNAKKYSKAQLVIEIAKTQM